MIAFRAREGSMKAMHDAMWEFPVTAIVRGAARGMAAVFAVVLLAASAQVRASTPPGVHDLIGRPAPDFHLVDQRGKDFVLSALRGRAVVLFFGYTHCPDICPTTLATIASALRR